MKKKLTNMVLTTAAATLLVSGMAFAQNDTELTEAPASVSAETTATDEEQTEAQYHKVSGTISSIEKKDNGGYTIMMDNEEGGIRFELESVGTLIDSADGSVKTLDDLDKDMKITAVLANNAPMGLSLPPMMSQVAAIVMDGEAGNTDVSIYNSELVNAENTLALTVGDDTQIYDLQGSKVRYSAEDLKDKELLVVYDVSTKSIPAQTTPKAVVILMAEESEESVATEEEITTETTEETAAESEGQTGEGTEAAELTPSTPVEVEPTEETTDASDQGPAQLALRAYAEEKGYKVSWIANDKPVIISKDEETISVSVGSNEVIVSGETKTLNSETKLTDDKIVVSGDFSQYLK